MGATESVRLGSVCIFRTERVFRLPSGDERVGGKCPPQGIDMVREGAALSAEIVWLAN